MGAMHRPMLECEPSSAHIIISRLLAALAFYSFSHGMMSSSFQVLNVARLQTPFELISGEKHFDPFAFYSQLMSSTS